MGTRNPLSGRERNDPKRVTLVCSSRKAGGLPAVYVPVGFSFGRELDCSGFLGCGSDVAGCVGEASEFGSIVVVVVEVEFLPGEHELSAAYAGCAVGVGE